MLFFALTATISTALLYVLGLYIFRYSLVRGLQGYGKYEEVLFCAVFSLSSGLFEVIALNVVWGGEDYRVRQVILWGQMLTLLLLLLVGIPAVYTYNFLSYKFGLRRSRSLIGAAMVVVGFNQLFWWAARGVMHQQTGKGGWLAFFGVPTLHETVEASASLGVWIAALLAGYGTVLLPYSYLALFVRPVTARHVRALESHLTQASEEVVRKQAELEQLKLRIDSSAVRNGSRGMAASAWGWISGTGPRGSQAQIRQLRDEVSALQALVAAVSVEVVDARRDCQRARESRTPLGHVKNALGYLLSIYCILRMLVSLKNLLVQQDFTKDPITSLLGLSVHLFSGGRLQVNIAQLQQTFTLAFVLFITFNSVRAFLKHTGKLFYYVAGLGSVSALVAMLSELTGFYAIATLLLVQQNLPIAHRSLVRDALGVETAAQLFSGWFNFLFLASAAATMSLLYQAHRSSQQDFNDFLPGQVSLPV